MIAPSSPGPAALLTLQFLAWLADRPRAYPDVMEAWRSSCPRLAIWEDAVADDLVYCDGNRIVGLTARGRAMLEGAEGGARPS